MHWMQTTLDRTCSPLPVGLLNELAGSLQKLGLRQAPPDAADLIETARRRHGLDDFGPGDFFEPLSRLLDSCHREARLNLIGKIALRSDIIRILSNRLLMERDRKHDPGIASQVIAPPLFIVGLPRSGTTLLHTLLAEDRDHRSPLVWEVMFPSPASSRDEKRRIRRTSRELACLQWLAPTFRHVHAVGAELPQECIGLMSPSMLSDQFDTMYRIPSYRSWFFKQDLTPAYQVHYRFLQHLQRRRQPTRWILKAPAHMFALPALLSVYPDALFLQVHRDPMEAVASVSSLVSILRSVFSNQVDPYEVGRDALQYWTETMTVFLQQRDRVPSARICDLYYTDVRRDPVAAIRRIYAHFNWTFSEETEQRMRGKLANQPREQNGFHYYDAAQFGLDAGEVAMAFGSYCDRFGLSKQSGNSKKAVLSSFVPSK
jgi:hypothetical protein